MTPYDTIATFGLVGDDFLDHLTIPDDDAIRADAIGTAFDALTGPLRGTLLEALDLEPLLWSFVNLFQTRARALERDRHKLEETMRTLIRSFDGTEIGDVELQDAQREHAQIEERETAFILMREHAADLYEAETGKPWAPKAGSRTGRAVSAAVIDARDYLRAAKERETLEKAPDGTRVVIAGGQDFENTDLIFASLDKARDRYGDMILLHGGATKGTDHIASLWARERNIPQVAFKPDFTAHKRAAPFKRNDAMLAMKPAGIIVFPGNGITENIAQKAEAQKVRVWRPKAA